MLQTPNVKLKDSEQLTLWIFLNFSNPNNSAIVKYSDAHNMVDENLTYKVKQVMYIKRNI